MKKLFFIVITIFGCSLYAQEDACSKYGNPTVIPDEGWCLYAENSRKKGEKAEYAECKCKEGKKKKETSKTVTPFEIYQKHLAKYKNVMKTVINLKEEDYDEKITLLNDLKPTASYLDVYLNTTSYSHSLYRKLEEYKRQKKYNTTTPSEESESNISNDYEAFMAEEKRKAQDYIKILEAEQRIEKEKREKANNQNTGNLNTVTTRFAEGVNEGVISHLELSYGWYDLEGKNIEDQFITNKMAIYELGIGFAGSFTISLSFGEMMESYEENIETFSVGGALDLRVLNLLGNDDFLTLGGNNSIRQKFLIKVYAGVEYNSYTNEYTADANEYYQNGSFLGVRFTGILYNFILFRYSIGTDEGDLKVNSSDKVAYSLPYSKISLGLQINF